MIAARRHGLRPERELGIDFFPAHAEHAVLKARAAGKNLCATRHAKRIGTNKILERQPILDEPIKVGRGNARIAERGDGVRPLIISNDHEKVRLCGLQRSHCQKNDNECQSIHLLPVGNIFRTAPSGSCAQVRSCK